MWRKELCGTWSGASELWLDPLGNTAIHSTCSLSLKEDCLSYEWSYEGKAQQGLVAIDGESASFSDTWHQPEAVALRSLESKAEAAYSYVYMEEWEWRIHLSYRHPTEELVVQMTNVAPWGEEARAVRMVCKRLDE